MLDDALGAYLDFVSERGFDEPFLALLRSLGFERIHLVHGASEFGKDVIAQRDGKQWTFQSKAGNVTQSGFRDMRGQLDELRLSELSHPAFNRDLPREPVLVVTGRLTGNAPITAQEYSEQAQVKSEPGLEVWSRDSLIEKLTGSEDSILRGSTDGQLLSLMGSIENAETTMDTIELFSRRWLEWDDRRLASLGIIEASLACEALARTERLDLACHLALCLVTAAASAAFEENGCNPAQDSAGTLFEIYAHRLWDECDDQLLGEKGLINYSGPSAWITYPIRCIRIGELLSLLSLRLQDSDAEVAAEIEKWVAEFIAAQPGAQHLVGDRYAVSLIPIALVLEGSNDDVLNTLLRGATQWTCDRYELDELGLAGVSAEPAEEISRLLGSGLEYVDLDRRRESQIAGVLLDLSAGMDMAELYPDIRNDLEAVGAYPLLVHTTNDADQYRRVGLGNRLEINPDYSEHIPSDHAPAAPHHSVAPRHLLEIERPWDLLAVSSALRDRHFFEAISHFAST